MMSRPVKTTSVLLTIFSITMMCLISCSKENEPTQPQPTLISLSVNEGEAGTSLTLTGTNFGTDESEVQVFFAESEAVISSMTSTQIVTIVPSIAPGLVEVKVRVKTLETTSRTFTILAPITINVTDFSKTIAENPIAGEVLGVLQATTNRGSLNFTISTQNPAGALSINGSNGEITVADNSIFDFEVLPQFENVGRAIKATVTVTNDTESAVANVTIVVTNALEVTIQNYTADIAENPSPNAGIGQVSASALNSSSLPAFAIVSQSISGAVNIDASNGLITVNNAAVFDYEVNPVISGVVSATSRSETKTANFTINVTDVNEGPSVSVSVVAGVETTPGCYDGSTLEHTYFTQPFFGTLQNINGTPTIYMTDLTCGIKKITLGATTVMSAEYFPANVTTEQFFDVHPYSNYLLATRKVISPGKADVFQIAKITNDGNTINVTGLVIGNPLVVPVGLTVDAIGDIYVADQNGRKIRKFSNTGTALASIGTGTIGSTDGDVNTASFNLLRDVQLGPNNVLFIADRFSIRKYDPATGLVSTIAGINEAGDAVGASGSARFNDIFAIGLFPSGDLLIADYFNKKIKVLRSNGMVETLLDNLSSFPEAIMVQDNTTFYFTLKDKYALYKAVISN